VPRKPRSQLRKEKATTQTPERGKLLKVIGVDEQGEPVSEWSKQLPVDPFNYRYTGLQEPPYPLEQLVFLAEQHAVHAAALEQKAADIIGTGWKWEAGDDTRESQKESNQPDKDALDKWFMGLADDKETEMTSHEVLTAAWEDLETLGQGTIELARDPKGELRYWYHVPAHTVRFHRDGVKVCQIREGKRVWFKRWIPEDDREIDKVTGKLGPKGSVDAGRKGNEIFVIKRPSRRSSWYGVPTYISATGWITLSTAARDDNIFFFENRREPRWAIILENVEDDPELEAQLRKALQVDLAEPHKNLLIPLSGPGKVTFKQLGDNKGDMSWENLQKRADTEILTGHRMPGERIGIVKQGALGGTSVGESVKVYKESVVMTSQALLASRVNKLIRNEGPVTDPDWKWSPKELDLTEEEIVLEAGVKGFQGGVLSLNEAREKVGEEPLGDEDDRGKKFFFELAPAAAKAQMEQSAKDGGTTKDSGGGSGFNRMGDELKQHIQDMITEGRAGAEAT
jgi:PBSX family phage portal protein